MKGHYFTEVVTEQRRLGGTSWPRKDNLVVSGAAPEFLEFCAFEHLERELLTIKMAMFSWSGKESWGQGMGRRSKNTKESKLLFQIYFRFIKIKGRGGGGILPTKNGECGELAEGGFFQS